MAAAPVPGIHLCCAGTSTTPPAVQTILKGKLGDLTAATPVLNDSVTYPCADISKAVQVVLEGKLVNLDVTSPAATMALALMFLKTNDQAVGSSFTVPQTHFALDYVRPDFILLRVFARGLVLWDSVQPTREWVQAQLPEMIQVGAGVGLHRGSCCGPRCS